MECALSNFASHKKNLGLVAWRALSIGKVEVYLEGHQQPGEMEWWKPCEVQHSQMQKVLCLCWTNPLQQYRLDSKHFCSEGSGCFISKIWKWISSMSLLRRKPTVYWFLLEVVWPIDRGHRSFSSIQGLWECKWSAASSFVPPL